MKYNSLYRYGPVAQLGERCVRIAEVRGSNPLRSTNSMEVMGMKLIKTIVQGKLASTVATGGCGACKNSCQSACKTSCTVGNQVCQK
jgi:predicted ribosomally synthesized six-cysteine peptide SCIFF